jgi:DNA (cytosine-5)-methyltransferase 1
MQNQTTLSPLRCNPLLYGSLFSGIGGIDLGFDRAGLKCAWQVEIDPFARKVLEKHWPGVPKHDDIRTFKPTAVDVIAGGFPCQDISNAGKRAGIAEGTRSGLWSEYVRIIREVRPKFVVVENVGALLVRGIGRVLGDLAESGYDAEWDVLRASRFGAAHRRERVFIVAYPAGIRLEGRVLSTVPQQLPRVGDKDYRFTVTEPIGVGTDHGIPSYVDRVRACGNAVVPYVAQWIGRRLIESV